MYVPMRRSASAIFSRLVAYERRMWWVPCAPNAVPASTQTPASARSASASSLPVHRGLGAAQGRDGAVLGERRRAADRVDDEPPEGEGERFRDDRVAEPPAG